MVWNPNPVAFEIFGISIAWYGLSWSLAIILGYFVMRFIFKKEHKNLNKLVPYIQYIFICSLLGARLFEMLFYQTDLFLNNPFRFFYFRDGGLASHGAMLGTFIAIALFLKQNNKEFSFAWLLDRSLIAALLQGAIVRLGNFMNSELYGTISDVPWSVQFVQVDTLARHPVQLYESLWLFCCFVLYLLIYVNAKQLRPWFLSGLFSFVLIGRIVLEFFKESDTYFWIFSKTQCISFVVILIALAILVFSFRQKKH